MTQTPGTPKDEPISPLRGQLLESSTKFARLAMQDYLDGNMGQFFVHAGTALEQLSKHYLAGLDPVLIADGRSFDSLLHLSGKGRHSRIAPNRIKTISASQVLDRCGQILPTIANLREQLRPLIDARDGSIHVGAVDESEKLAMLVPYLRASSVLLGEDGVENAAYWGDFHDIVQLRLAEQTEAAATRVKEGMLAAGLRFQQKYGHLDDEVKPAVLAAIEHGYAPDDYYEQLIHCPVCGTLGLASGSFEVEWETEYDFVDDEEVAVNAYPVVTFFPGIFVCWACGLELDGEDELAAADVELSWTLEDVEPADFMDEPDEEY